jgi:DNA polymerase-1
MPTLLLVDGSSYLYRAFHALPDLRNQAGDPTGAVYGVLAMLRRLLGDYKADYRACIFDAKGPTFRDEWYPDYKAHRPPMAEDLVRQIEPLHACIRAQGWPLLSIPGVEADDVIGTLARQASRQGMEVVISTGDKDLAQLVDGRTRLVNTMSNEILDEAGVMAKFGVPPTLIVDYLALIGDTSDNVPGVEKCGPKTALKWLSQYGDLAGVMAHADAVGGVVGQNLRRALSFLPLGQKLVTVVCDLALPLKPEELVPAEPDKGALLEWFEKLDFKTWRNELAGQESGIRDQTSESRTVGDEENHRQAYETILTWEALDTWLARIEASPLTSFDTETTSLEAMNAHLVGMSFSIATGQAAYLPQIGRAHV